MGRGSDPVGPWDGTGLEWVVPALPWSFTAAGLIHPAGFVMGKHQHRQPWGLPAWAALGPHLCVTALASPTENFNTCSFENGFCSWVEAGQTTWERNTSMNLGATYGIPTRDHSINSAAGTCWVVGSPMSPITALEMSHWGIQPPASLGVTGPSTEVPSGPCDNSMPRLSLRLHWENSLCKQQTPHGSLGRSFASMAGKPCSKSALISSLLLLAALAVISWALWFSSVLCLSRKTAPW